MALKPNSHKTAGAAYRRGWWIVLVLCLATVLWVRVRLLEIPLERDEGEYAYAGQLMRQGVPPYQLAYNMKFPGAYAAYAFFMTIFGETIRGVHLGLLAINAGAIALIFLIGRRLWNPIAGIAAATAYAVLSLSPSVMGFAAHATHFVVLPMLGGVLLLLRPRERQDVKRLMASGFLFGIAVLMKQPGAAFALFAGGYLFFSDWRAGLRWKKMLSRSILLALGVSIPLAICGLSLWWAGVFEKFWFWTVDYARAYAGIASLSTGRAYFTRNAGPLISSGWLLWSLAGIGLSACFWHGKTRTHAVFLVGLLAASALALSAGLYFREHYFVLILPAVSLLIGAGILVLTELFSPRMRVLRWAPLLVLASALALQFLSDKEFLFQLSPAAASRKIYWLNPFPESIQIAKYLRENTGEEETIAVLGSEPQICFYARRRSATGYLYTYALMESHKYALQMQREMIAEIERARPKYLLVVAVTPSWQVAPDSEQHILRWINQYCAENYTGVGLVSLSSKGTEYYLPLETPPMQYSRQHILIYRRNS